MPPGDKTKFPVPRKLWYEIIIVQTSGQQKKHNLCGRILPSEG